MKRVSFVIYLGLGGAIAALPGFAEIVGDVTEAQNAALIAAVRQGSSERIKAALDHGASPNATDTDKTPVLQRAIVFGDSQAVRLLLDRGADPNARSGEGGVALVLAAGDIEKVKALVDKGADVNLRSGMGRTALLTAASQRDSYRVVKFLLAKGADAKARDDSPEFLSGGKGATALMLAVRSRDNRTVRLLLDQGLDVNAANSAGSTALTEAISAHNAEAVRMLIERGARVNTEFGPLKQTPLIWASFQECPEIVEALLSAGADVNAKDALGSTALVWATMSERDDSATVSALLRAGASINVKTVMGETPLSWAQRRGNTEIVKLLGSEAERRKQ